MVADYSAQAVINTILSRTFPDDPIVGEEDAADLRSESASPLRNRIVELANEALTADLRQGEQPNWGLGPGSSQSVEELLSTIDRGTYAGGRSGRESSISTLIRIHRAWVLSRYVDTGPNRWDQRILTRGAICCLSSTHH